MESKKEMVAAYVEVMWNRHDLRNALEYLTPELADDVEAHALELFGAFSDLRVDILDPPGLIEDGDHVAMRLKVSGVHDSAEFAGQPPSGKRLEWESFRIMRFEDGKIAQTWAMQDRLALMEQLGAVESRAGEVHWAAGETE